MRRIAKEIKHTESDLKKLKFPSCIKRIFLREKLEKLKSANAETYRRKYGD